MPKELKKSVAFRLSADTVRKLEQLAALHKTSQASVLSVLIHFACVGEDMEQLTDWLNIAKLG